MNIHGMTITVISPVLVYEDGTHSLYQYSVNGCGSMNGYLWLGAM